MLPRAAEDHYRAQAAITAETTNLVRALWRGVKFRDLFGTYPRDAMLVAVSVGQITAAALADDYLTAVLAETNQDSPQVGAVQPGAFAGATDGRDMDDLLQSPVIATSAAAAAGVGEAAAMSAGLASLLRITATQVQDAGREAVGTGLTARTQITGYVRMLNPPSCSRCAVLAGKFFKWNDGFQRHPMCDCRHVPATENVAGDMTTDPLEAIKSGQVTGLSKADTQAIVEDGADVGQVINARRGMSTASGRKTTTEGTTARGSFGRTAGAGSTRLRPEAIYAQANGDRAEALRLLKRFGYLSD